MPIVAGIVDDDRSVRQAPARLLSQWQIDSKEYPTAAAFLGSLQHGEFDLVVIDQQLPDMPNSSALSAR